METGATKIVVIDPGHGGKNEGGKTDSYVEKYLNMQVALSIKEELGKYEGIEVYLTRDGDEELSLQQRVDFAESVNADLFVSLHFNMSEEHTLYGTECWVSAFGECYASAYDYAKIQNQLLVDLGLHNRGVKTRLSTKGIDYYGVIRAATEYQIPSCIVEHCHLDHIEDAGYVDQGDWLTKYGIVDATAIAKYFGLRSEVLNVDYSDEKVEKTKTPESIMNPDTTKPEECTVNEVVYQNEQDLLQVRLKAKESESMLCYYSYSLDSGDSFSKLMPWNADAEEMTIEISLPVVNTGDLVFRVYNNYDLYCESNRIDLSAYYERKTAIEQENQIANEVFQEQEEFIETFQTIVYQEQDVPMVSTITKSYAGIIITIVVAAIATIELLYIRGKMKKRAKK